MKTILKKIFAISCVVMICASVAISQVTGPIFPTTIQSGGFTKYDTNGYPYVNAGTITATVTTSTNVDANITGGTNYTYILNDTVTYADIGSNGLGSASSKPIWTTNAPTTIIQTDTPLYTKGTNQSAWSYNYYSLGDNTTDAGVVTNVAWSTTNGCFTAAGGSGVLTDITITSSTNRDYVLWFFPKVVSGQTAASAWTPVRSTLQGMRGPWATTNTLYCSEWQIIGTNYVKRINMAVSAKNSDASTNCTIVATYLDTRADVAANAIQVEVGMINDKSD